MLSVVSTPIGNLEDITLRAIRILTEADLIVCEDTRVTKKLLQKYNIDTRTAVFHANMSSQAIEKYLHLLGNNKHIALVSDAGTPGISDPGVLLVMKARELNYEVEVIPGPSALTAAVAGAGIPMHEFLFLGFLPQKKGRDTLFREIAESKRPVVFYESPHRIEKTLASLEKYAPQKHITFAREMTKLFEEFVTKLPCDHIGELEEKKPRGEYVVIVK